MGSFLKGKEFFLNLQSSQLACQAWGDEKGEAILALHGSLDNSASFDFLIPSLLKSTPNLYIIAVDLPGHGLSEHINRDYGFFFMNYISILFEIMDTLKWKRCILLGHSMGAAISTIAAGTIPERISHLILLDAVGPISFPDSQAPNVYRSFLQKQTEYQQKKKKKRMIKIDAMTRLKANINQISKEAARKIVSRNASKSTNKREVTWELDERLQIHSPIFLTEEQVTAFIQKITARTLILLAKDEFRPGITENTKKNRLPHFQSVEFQADMPGGHHFHLKSHNETARRIVNWLHTVL